VMDCHPQRQVGTRVVPKACSSFASQLCVESTMQKKPPTFAETFHNIFNTHVLLGIICGLLGVIAVRLMGA